MVKTEIETTSGNVIRTDSSVLEIIEMMIDWDGYIVINSYVLYPLGRGRMSAGWDEIHLNVNHIITMRSLRMAETEN